MAVPNGLKGKITRAYLLALCVVATLSIAAFAVAHKIVGVSKQNTQIMEVAMRQATAPAQVGALLRGFVAGAPSDQALRRLETWRQEILEAHEILTDFAATGDVEGLRRLYFDGPARLDARMRGFASQLAQIIAEPRVIANPEVRAGVVREASDTLQRLQRAAAAIHAAEAARRVDESWNWAAAALAVTLAALLLEGVFIFYPLTRMILRRTEALIDAKSTLEHAASHDALTGLLNRAGLADLLERRRREASGADSGIGLLHVGLDRFSVLNYALGHDGGDALLVDVAKRLREQPGAPLVARVGGDEFVLAFEGCADEAALALLAETVRLALCESFSGDYGDCRLSASIGAVFAAPRGGKVERRGAERLLMDADIALYRAKGLGRDRTEIFTHLIREDVCERQRIGAELREALEQASFEPYYQPQVDAKTRALCGFEALARWRHPTRGVLSPSDFMSVAEDLDLVDRIDTQIMRAAFAQARAWREAGLAPPRVSINMSARRLSQHDLATELRVELDRARLTPADVAIEVLESVMLERQTAEVSWNLEALADLGVAIELDDFGTGHASLSNLQRLKPHRLKIDRGFVTGIEADDEQRDLVATMIEMAKRVGAGVVAEGVETAEQADMVEALGGDVLQGYLFAKPLAPADAATWLSPSDGALARESA